MTAQDNKAALLAFIGQVWNQGDLVQLEQTGFEVAFEGGEQGVGHGRGK